MKENKQKSLYESYISQLSMKFDSSGKKNQKDILHSLELLLSGNDFDGNLAKKIRIKAGFSVLGLAKKMGVGNPKSVRTMLYKYEKCERVPSNPPIGEDISKYLYWLKERGYNPYHLS